MVRKKTPACTVCGKPKETIFLGEGIRYPTLSCPEHGPDPRNEWEMWIAEYKDEWKDEAAWDVPNRKLSCFVGYFCHKFSEFYGHPYVFAYGNPIPYKDRDFMMARRVLTMFGENAREAAIYIRWVFAKRIRSPKYAINSIGFFASSKFVNEYFQAKAENAKLKRSTKLPSDFLAWCVQHCPEIFEKQELETWNDLNGLVTHVQSYGMDSVEGKVVSEAINRNMLPSGGYAKLEG
jgi:hypothetical protein